MRKLLTALILGGILVVAGYAITGGRPQRSSDNVMQAGATVSEKPKEKLTILQLAQSTNATGALAAIRHAVDANKYMFLFIYEKNDEATRESKKKFDAAVQNLGSKVEAVSVDRAAPAESELMEYFDLKTTPMPVVLVLAPNGAITGGFLSARISEQKLLDAVVGTSEQACLKALQDGKLVLLCAQNSVTADNDSAMKGVDAFKADLRYAQRTEIIKFDPADPAESKFLQNLRLVTKIDRATTVFLVPPGSIAGQFTGATTKEQLAVALQKASASCSGSPGCCPTAK